MDSKVCRHLGTPILTNNQVPKFLPASPLRLAHLFTSSCAPQCQTGRGFCISRQRTPHRTPITPATCHPRYQPHATPTPTAIPVSPGGQRKHARADLRARVPSAVDRDGKCRTVSGTARRFPSANNLFPPAGPQGEVSLRQASTGLGLVWHRTAALQTARDPAWQWK